MRVLIFDDLLVHRQEEFAALEADVRFFADADDAVAVVETVAPDLVLMDFAMEARLTGDRAVAALRVRWPRGQLRIVGISSDGPSNQRLVAAGADEAVPKSHLRAWLRGQMERAARRAD